MTAREATHADFERLSWHDNHIYGLRFAVGDPELGDWRSDLVFDIDHIVEWVRGDRGRLRFRVAPATLTFHDVTDLRLAIDWGDSGFRTALHEVSIDALARERIAQADQKVCLDWPYYRWRITLNWPQGSGFRFGASDFTLDLRAEPVLQDQQQLSPRDRV